MTDPTPEQAAALDGLHELEKLFQDWSGIEDPTLERLIAGFERVLAALKEAHRVGLTVADIDRVMGARPRSSPSPTPETLRRHRRGAQR